ncbi:synaptogenesis protein syg-1-like [Diadema antillarum]|uniref:synaptogenesis protein syg-1-like n=1 Tax=Diadema antillarum TaxID=105358 RepID=UPI003A884820
MATVSSTCLSLVFCLVCLVSRSLQQNPIVMGPVDTSTSVGHDAVFYCKIRADTNNLVYWVVNREIGLGPLENDNPAYPQYEITGNHKLGYYNLKITNVTADDASRYDCVIDNPGDGPTYEAGAMLTVVNDPVRPTGPTCPTGSGDIFLVEGDVLQNYRCQAEDGVPIGELRWNVIRDDNSFIDIDYEIQVDNAGQITVVSGSHVLTADDHLSQLACTLTHPLVSDGVCSYPNDDSRIFVRHFPQVEIGPDISVHYLESTEVTVRCTASAYPDISFGPQFSSSDPEMSFDVTLEENGLIEARVQVSQSDVGTLINCSASNSLGTTTTSIEITLQPVLPSWLLITVLICAVVLLLFLSLICCFCCCGGCNAEKKGKDNPDLADTKAAGYDVNDSRPNSIYKPSMDDQDDDGFSDIPLDDFTPPSPPPPPPPPNDIETGEINDGYLSPDADERFPPMIEDEHLMGEKRISTFKADDDEVNPPPPPLTPPPPPPPEDMDSTVIPIPSIEDD